MKYLSLTSGSVEITLGAAPPHAFSWVERAINLKINGTDTMFLHRDEAIALRDYVDAWLTTPGAAPP